MSEVPSYTQRNVQTLNKSVFKTEAQTGKNECTVLNTNQRYGLVQGLDDCDDSAHDIDYNGPEVSMVMLNVEFLDICNSIGDLCDDDDIS